jgi:hypothetical protein
MAERTTQPSKDSVRLLTGPPAIPEATQTIGGPSHAKLSRGDNAGRGDVTQTWGRAASLLSHRQYCELAVVLDHVIALLLIFFFRISSPTYTAQREKE